MKVGVDQTSIKGLYLKDNRLLVDKNSEYADGLLELDGMLCENIKISSILRKSKKFDVIKLDDYRGYVLLMDNKCITTIDTLGEKFIQGVYELNSKLKDVVDLYDLLDLYSILGVDVLAVDNDYLYLDGNYVSSYKNNRNKHKVRGKLIINSFTRDYMDYINILRVDKNDFSLKHYVNISNDLSEYFSLFDYNKIGFKSKYLLEDNITHLLLLDLDDNVMLLYDLEYGIITNKREVQKIKGNILDINLIDYKHSKEGNLVLDINCSGACEAVQLRL